MRGQATNYNPAAVAITGGTITGTNVAYVLGRSNIPFIGLSSGSVSAAGAISAITALPIAYPAAYCYFPANALATAIAAGWYYCTFSTTTAGTAFLDTYTSGTPAIPASPTAVTDGKGAFTGDTGEEFGPTFTLPASALGVSGGMKIQQQYLETSNANVKTGRVRFSGNAGTIMLAHALASTAAAGLTAEILNTGAVGAQISTCTGFNGGGTVTSSVIASVSTAAQTTLVFSLQRATATDNLILGSCLVEVFF
jgi:hypothetical protein